MLENELLRDFALLDSLVRAHKGTAPGGEALESVRAFADREIQSYAAEADVTRKQAIARNLIDCMEGLDALALTLAELPETLAEIEDLYTDEVWNNFTATVMEEKLKKRLTRAYRELAIPHLLRRLQATLSCDSANSLNREVESIHQRMRSLREEDTDRLEDALRSVEQPAAAYRLISTPVQ